MRLRAWVSRAPIARSRSLPGLRINLGGAIGLSLSSFLTGAFAARSTFWLEPIRIVAHPPSLLRLISLTITLLTLARLAVARLTGLTVASLAGLLLARLLLARLLLTGLTLARVLLTGLAVALLTGLTLARLLVTLLARPTLARLLLARLARLLLALLLLALLTGLTLARLLLAGLTLARLLLAGLTLAGLLLIALLAVALLARLTGLTLTRLLLAGLTLASLLLTGLTLARLLLAGLTLARLLLARLTLARLLLTRLTLARLLLTGLTLARLLLARLTLARLLLALLAVAMLAVALLARLTGLTLARLLLTGLTLARLLIARLTLARLLLTGLTLARLLLIALLARLTLARLLLARLALLLVARLARLILARLLLTGLTLARLAVALLARLTLARLLLALLTGLTLARLLIARLTLAGLLLAGLTLVRGLLLLAGLTLARLLLTGLTLARLLLTGLTLARLLLARLLIALLARLTLARLLLAGLTLARLLLTGLTLARLLLTGLTLARLLLARLTLARLLLTGLTLARLLLIALLARLLLALLAVALLARLTGLTLARLLLAGLTLARLLLTGLTLARLLLTGLTLARLLLARLTLARLLLTGLTLTRLLLARLTLARLLLTGLTLARLLLTGLTLAGLLLAGLTLVRGLLLLAGLTLVRGLGIGSGDFGSLAGRLILGVARLGRIGRGARRVGAGRGRARGSGDRGRLIAGWLALGLGLARIAARLGRGVSRGPRGIGAWSGGAVALAGFGTRVAIGAEEPLELLEGLAVLLGQFGLGPRTIVGGCLIGGIVGAGGTAIVVRAAVEVRARTIGRFAAAGVGRVDLGRRGGLLLDGLWLLHRGLVGTLALLLLAHGEFLGREGVDDLEDLPDRLEAVGLGLLRVADRQPVFELVAGTGFQGGQVEQFGPADRRLGGLLLEVVDRSEDRPPPVDMEGDVLEAEVVGGLEDEVDRRVARDLEGRLGRIPEGGRRGGVLEGVDVVDDRLGVGLAAGGGELDRVGAALGNLEATREREGVLGGDRHRDRAELAQVDLAGAGRLIRPGPDGDDRPLDRLDVAPLEIGASRGLGVGREVVVELDPRDHRRREDVELVAEALGVARGDVVLEVLLDVPEGRLPGVVVVLAGGELGGGEELAAVGAVVEDDLLGPGPLRLDGEGDVRPGHDLRQVLVVARLDVDQSRVGRPDHVGQERPAGRVDDALGRQERIEAEGDHDRRQDVGHLDQAALIHDRVDLDPGQVADRLGLDGRHRRAGELGAVPAEVEVADQAVLERRVDLLDRPGGVEIVDPPDQGEHDRPGRIDPRARQSAVEDQAAGPGRQADRVIEQDLREEDRQGRRDQGGPGGQDVGHPNLGPGPLELVVDVLLVVEQLPVGLRAYGHRRRPPRSTCPASVPPIIDGPGEPRGGPPTIVPDFPGLATRRPDR